MTSGVGSTLAALSVMLGALGVTSLAPVEQGETRGASALPECIFVRATARPKVEGYNHWVFIENRCDKPAVCDVTTNINPSTMTVAVKPGTTADVLTFRHSQEPKFTPYVTCTLVQGH